MEKDVLHIFSTQLTDNTLTPATHYKAHPNWSSLAALVVLNEIEWRTSVLISIEAFNRCTAIADICREVDKQQTTNVHPQA